jgi:hypothetical protein
MTTRFVVDNWFFDNWQAAAVIQPDAWRRGKNPNDGE